MAYEVLARKWRPQTFEDVVGQEHVTRTLRNAIENNRIAHAYLFVGSRGIGKTSIARIFAKALNCSKGPTATPCGVCDSCKEIVSGSSLDVLEIDGASNNSVDQIRDLRETVRYQPTHGKFKIYIIDEVHMLSTAAFNALLKTLEEPPAHVKFFFATTEPERVLATIVSRCQRFDLRRIPAQLLVERLRLIAKTEKVEVTDDALIAVARGAEGGLRDAESALDQLISFKGTKIEEEDVLSVFGLVSRKTLEDVAEKILTGDVKSLLRLVAELDRSGKDLQRFVLELMEHFRNLLVCQQVDEPNAHMDLTDAQIEVLMKQMKLADTARLLRVAEILGETEERMKKALSRRTLLEMALIRCARAVTVVSLEEILKKINTPGNEPAQDVPPARSAAAAPVRENKRQEEPARESNAEAETSVHEGESDELELLRSKWPDIMDKVAKITPFARNALRDAKPLAVNGDKVIVGLDAEFADRSEKSEAERNHLAVEKVISSILKRDVAVEFKIAELNSGDGGGGGGMEEKGEVKVDPPAKTAHKGGKTADSGNIEDHPLVKKTQDLFGGRVINVRK
jgi:DNA polymerase-3 subunit gamma/tau